MSERPAKFDSGATGQQAADWVARRDRGLSPAGQDDYLQWLREDPQRAAMITQHEATVRRLQQLAGWQPVQSSEPNPDLFARPRRVRRYWLPMLATMAAVVVIGGLVLRRSEPAAPVAVATKSFLRVNERQVLADGSIVEVRDGSRIEVAFTETERRVRLTGGEAHFTVAKNAAWPFVVEAGRVVIRAVGTAFAVRLDAALVDVVVTEGKLRVEQPATSHVRAGDPAFDPVVPASHRAVVSFAESAPGPQVTAVTTEQMNDALSWQAPRFQFHETPLSDAVAEFNRHNRQQIQIGDGELARMLIGGTFRVDNVDGFVSLLELSLGIRAEWSDKGPVLRSAR